MVVSSLRCMNDPQPEGHIASDRLRALAAELVRRQVALIVAAGSSSALAAKAATTTLPSVFSVAVDPVAVGLVTRLDRPGGNVTGVTNLSVELVQKQVEMLHELVPTATVAAALLNPTFFPVPRANRETCRRRPASSG